MASHEDTLAQLQSAIEQCHALHGVMQNAMQGGADLRGLLQNSLGNTAAYAEIAAYIDGVVGGLEQSTQATEQAKQAIEALMSRFQG